MAKKKMAKSGEKEEKAMGYKLKANENEFQMTREGKFEYHTFRHGEIYQEIPAGEESRFEEVEEE